MGADSFPVLTSSLTRLSIGEDGSFFVFVLEFDRDTIPGWILGLYFSVGSFTCSCVYEPLVSLVMSMLLSSDYLVMLTFAVVHIVASGAYA